MSLFVVCRLEMVHLIAGTTAALDVSCFLCYRYSTFQARFLHQPVVPSDATFVLCFEVQVISDVLEDWLYAHLEHPYPTKAEKKVLAAETGLTHKAITNWFVLWIVYPISCHSVHVLTPPNDHR